MIGQQLPEIVGGRGSGRSGGRHGESKDKEWAQ
jgi:hypothetical protein